MNCTVPQTAAFCTPFQARQGRGEFMHAVLFLAARSPDSLTDWLPADQGPGDLYSAFLPGSLLP